MNYIYDIGTSHLLTFDADANMRSSSYSDFDLDKATKESGYTKVNLRLGFAPSDNNWSIYAYGKNIGNVQRYSFIFDTPNVPGSYTGTPGLGRILGVGFTKNF